MAKLDHARRSATQRMHRQGTEAAGDLDVVYRPGQPVKRMSKAEMRQETARLLKEFFARKSKSPPRI